MNEVSLKYQGADIVMTSNEEKGQRTKEGVKVLIGRAEKSREEQSRAVDISFSVRFLPHHPQSAAAADT